MLTFQVIFRIRSTCTDHLFSGHTVNFILMSFVWLEYAEGLPWFKENNGAVQTSGTETTNGDNGESDNVIETGTETTNTSGDINSPTDSTNGSPTDNASSNKATLFFPRAFMLRLTQLAICKYTILACLLMIATHFHYSVDVS
jgi:hypothetical protein